MTENVDFDVCSQRDEKLYDCEFQIPQDLDQHLSVRHIMRNKIYGYVGRNKTLGYDRKGTNTFTRHLNGIDCRKQISRSR
ncbi:hypothetical protein KIN20_037511 [Parelaphostrongylus tenuis]|uniref:Uncharacterized protein n=1 Tax=Parelaphostrongylus tenuis TaxID=148309 RepID=A0AAD5REC9_PARTN|nr:hypothetical protein KIN20_037508 [Parelaphostrongylus tenuis]KAJ1374750.1 hypothetical protein KIN20_037511 [Parelaphostrongylus tenuis]